MSNAALYSSREEIDVYQFGWFASVGVPLLALVIQAFAPLRLGFVATMDFPLQLTIFFALARRRPISGLLTGAVIGTLQDALTRHPIGLNGMAKTVIGYVASSLGVKLNVDNPGSRFLITFAFYLLHQLIYVAIDVALVGNGGGPTATHVLGMAVANSVVAVLLFSMLDKLKHRA